MHDAQMEAMRRYQERQQQEQENPDLFEPLPPPLRQLNREQGRHEFNYNQLTQPEGGRRKRRTKRNRKSKRNNKRSRKSKRRY
jgi:hypothetical protein